MDQYARLQGQKACKVTDSLSKTIGILQTYFNYLFRPLCFKILYVCFKCQYPSDICSLQFCRVFARFHCGKGLLKNKPTLDCRRATVVIL